MLGLAKKFARTTVEELEQRKPLKPAPVIMEDVTEWPLLVIKFPALQPISLRALGKVRKTLINAHGDQRRIEVRVEEGELRFYLHEHPVAPKALSTPGPKAGR